jgi:hypothetical protein
MLWKATTMMATRTRGPRGSDQITAEEGDVPLLEGLRRLLSIAKMAKFPGGTRGTVFRPRYGFSIENRQKRGINEK